MDKINLKQILLDQRAEIAVLMKKRIIERDVIPFSAKDIKNDLIKVIMGVRRSGKSVFSHLMLKDTRYGYMNFDDERLMGLKADDLNAVYQVLLEIYQNVKTLIFDEIQNVLGWELFVNRLKRKGRSIIVTGSNSHLLSHELSTHLTGRYLACELFPFSFKEYLSYFQKGHLTAPALTTEQKAEILALLNDYLSNGGFPETLTLDAAHPYLRELYDKLITRDIVLRYSLKHSVHLKDIALYLISNFGNRFSYNRINNILEMKSVHTVQNYVDYLEQAYLVFKLNPFSFKVSESIKQPRKIYCVDTGMIHALAPKTTIDAGRMIENCVFLELKRRAHDIFFYNTKQGEVDFIIRKENKISELIQVCLDMNNPETYKREAKALSAASADLSCGKLTLITWDTEAEKKENGKSIQCIPVWKWLLGGC